MNVGDKVQINAKYRTEFTRGLVGGKIGTIEKIHYYPQRTYDIKYDEPFKYMGFSFDTGNYYRQELERFEV